MIKNLKEKLIKYKQKYPAECAFIELLNECGAYDKQENKEVKFK